jgi:hypothetical protein
MNIIEKAFSGEWISESEIRAFSEEYQKEFGSIGAIAKTAGKELLKNTAKSLAWTAAKNTAQLKDPTTNMVSQVGQKTPKNLIKSGIKAITSFSDPDELDDREFGYRGANNKYEYLRNKVSQANEGGDRESAVKYRYKLANWDKKLRKSPIKAKLQEMGGAATHALGSFIKRKALGGDKHHVLNQYRDEWDSRYG